MKKALAKLVDAAVNNVKDADSRRLMITHCNNPSGAESVRKGIEERIKVKEVVIMDTAGISSMYANDGGVIVTL